MNPLLLIAAGIAAIAIIQELTTKEEPPKQLKKKKAKKTKPKPVPVEQVPQIDPETEVITAKPDDAPVVNSGESKPEGDGGLE